MKREVTLYETLEVSPHASAPVIKAAYRCLAQFNHPDKKSGSDAAIERQTQINHAYSVLSDLDKRQRYDQTIKLQKCFIDRRGSGAATPGSFRPEVGDHQVSRPFAFRPLN